MTCSKEPASLTMITSTTRTMMAIMIVIIIIIIIIIIVNNRQNVYVCIRNLDTNKERWKPIERF